MKSMGAFIKVHFGTHAKLNDALGLGKNTVNRWYNSNPRQFFMYLPELQKWSGEPTDQIIEMIKTTISKSVKIAKWVWSGRHEESRLRNVSCGSHGPF